MSATDRPDAAHWHSWSPEERESFFAAIARHRRAAWRVTAACGVGYAILSAVVAVLLAPLLWAVAGVLVDLVNIVVPAPDLLGWAGRFVSPLFDDASAPGREIARILIVAATPGLLAMLVLAYSLSHVIATSPLFAGDGVDARSPSPHVLAERRIANVTEEMALAAGLRAPRVLIVPGGVNAAVSGTDVRPVVLVGEQLLGTLSRAQMQGVVAHLIGSFADGDLRIGRRTATTLASFAVIARFSGGLNDPSTFRRTLSLWRAFVHPTATNTAALLRALADPFDDAALPTDAETRAARGESARSTHANAVAAAPSVAAGDTPNTLTWRQWAAMPLAGPLIMTGFLAGLVSQFLLGPLVSLAWRRRKYMADATAVRLTRDPDAFASALVAMGRARTGLPGWATHLAVAGAGPSIGGLFGGTIVDIFPSLQSRGRALVRLGASVVAPSGGPRLEGAKFVLIVGLFAIAGVLMCVVAVLMVAASLALSMLFTGLPVVLLHALLRAIGH